MEFLSDFDNVYSTAGQFDLMPNPFIEYFTDDQDNNDSLDSNFLTLSPVDEHELLVADVSTVTPSYVPPPLTPHSTPPQLIPDDGYSPVRVHNPLTPGGTTMPPTPENGYVYPFGDLDQAQYSFPVEEMSASELGLLLEGCPPQESTSQIQLDRRYIDPNMPLSPRIPSYVLTLQNEGNPQYELDVNGVVVTASFRISQTYESYSMQTPPMSGGSSYSAVLGDPETNGPSMPANMKTKEILPEPKPKSRRHLKGRKGSSRASRAARVHVNESPLKGRTKAQRDFAELTAHLPPVSPLASSPALASTSTPTTTSHIRPRARASASTSSAERKFVCGQCGRRYKTQILLDEHMAFTIEHDVFKTDAELPLVRWVCPKHRCPFTVPTSLQRHCSGQGCMPVLDAWCASVGISRKEYLSIKYVKNFCPMARAHRRDGRWARRIEETVRRGGFAGGDVEIDQVAEEDEEEENPVPTLSA